MSTLREQIAARRAEVRKAATPVKGQARRLPSDDTLPEERTSSGQIKKAVRSGKSFPLVSMMYADEQES
jgi:predicted RNA methylase